MSIKKEKLKVYDMTCTSCENRVEKAVKSLNGVLSAKASFSGQSAEVEFDDELCNLNKIKAAIKGAGYGTESSKDYKFIGILIVVAAVVLLGMNTSGFDMEAKLNNASYAVLFIVGLLTSIHCVGMCGGIMISQSLKNESKSKFEAIKPAILYNAGRVVSYTILGGLFGAFGSFITISIPVKAGLQIFAGVFMIMMGFNMAGFNLFRKFNIKLPKALCNIKSKSKSRSPLIVGFLNGLMPCGPLQTMQLFAFGTGSAAKGALSMFVFSIGTVPLMLTFGAISGILSKGYTKKILKLSGVLIIVLGFIMGNRGFALVGVDINPLTVISNTAQNLTGGSSSKTAGANVAKATIQDGVQVINMTADSRGYTPNAVYVQKGIPVKWVIDGKQLNSCNNSIVAQSLNLQWKLKSGENVKEFTPGDKDINFSCWMGMIRGVIKVVDNLGSVDSSKADPSLPPAGAGPSCCAGGPVNDGSGQTSQPNQPSIYGSDITKIPTATLVNEALVSGKSQSANFKGIGYELQPLIVVTGSSEKTKLTFDLSAFDNAEGKYSIFDAVTGDEITSFTGKKGINDVEFSPKKAGGYAIVKDNVVLGIIEVVGDLNTTDMEKVRQQYLGQ